MHGSNDLSKVHKPGCPFRSIVSSIDTFNYNLAPYFYYYYYFYFKIWHHMLYAYFSPSSRINAQFTLTNHGTLWTGNVLFYSVFLFVSFTSLSEASQITVIRERCNENWEVQRSLLKFSQGSKISRATLGIGLELACNWGSSRSFLLVSIN